MIRCYITILCILVYCHSIADEKHKKISILPVPAFGYAPETRTYVGAVSLFTFNLYQDSLTRTSNAKLELNYTWNKQLIVETDWNYFFKEERWFTKGRVHYSKFPDRYYGVGTHTPDSNEYLYISNRLIAEAHVLKKISDNLFTGPGIRYTNYSKVSPTEIAYPELRDNTSLYIGYTLLQDSRNNLLNAKTGSYINIDAGYTLQQRNAELITDTRYYHTWRKHITWANRWYNEVNFGNPAFYDYALLGGDKFVRGYYLGRFRDNNLSTLQTELRAILVWRLGLAVFGGVSNLYSSFGNFNLADSKYNYGLGLRFLIDRKEDINLRIDYAMGQGNNSGFYISFGESF